MPEICGKNRPASPVPTFQAIRHHSVVPAGRDYADRDYPCGLHQRIAAAGQGIQRVLKLEALRPPGPVLLVVRTHSQMMNVRQAF